MIVMLAIGAIPIASTQFVPQVLQGNHGYTDTWAVWRSLPSGPVTVVMMFKVGQLTSRIQPKYLIVIGARSSPCPRTT